MGAIPIVKSSASDSLFDGLPVLIISNWHEVTEELLQKKYKEIGTRPIQAEKLTLDYWLKQIDAVRKNL